LKESDLFAPVKAFLLESGCSDVYGEVLGCDVLGINGSSNIIVELKTSLSFKLIDQAIERLNFGHYVYIAIPKRKSHVPRCVRAILETNKIGLLEVGEDNWTKELIATISIPARFNRLATERQKKGFNRIREHIKPYNETQVGGVKGGEAVTDYSVMIENIKDFLRYNKRGKWVTVEEILEHCETYYANPKPSLMATLQAHWNRNWCETKIENRKRYFRYIM
jgi:hypothetical protein